MISIYRCSLAGDSTGERPLSPVLAAVGIPPEEGIGAVRSRGRSRRSAEKIATAKCHIELLDGDL